MTAPHMALYNQAFLLVAEMESDLSSAEHFARAVAMLAETIDDDKVGLVFQEVAGAIIGHCREIEEKRAQLFHLLHPARDHFEQEGWPGDQTEGGTG